MTKTIGWPLILSGSRGRDRYKSASLEEARKFLGKGKVLRAKNTARAWGGSKFKDCPTGYLAETLELCAEENAAGKADWRLTFHLGQSPAAMYSARGHDEKRQPCFHLRPSMEKFGYRPFHILDSNMREDRAWIAEVGESRYWLTDFTPRFPKMRWEEQERCICALGPSFKRTHEAVFIEAAMSIFMLTGKRLAEDWFHWGISTHHGYHLMVGRFSSAGLMVEIGWPGHWGLHTVVSRMHDAP